MARSTYIYSVEDVEPGPSALLAVFTVKREMVGWLGRQDPAELVFMRITRHSDGCRREDPVPMGTGKEVYERECE